MCTLTACHCYNVDTWSWSGISQSPFVATIIMLLLPSHFCCILTYFLYIGLFFNQLNTQLTVPSVWYEKLIDITSYDLLLMHTGGSPFESNGFCLEQASTYHVSNNWVVKPTLHRATLCQSSPLPFPVVYSTSIPFTGPEQKASELVYLGLISSEYDTAKCNTSMWHQSQHTLWVLLFFYQLTSVDVEMDETHWQPLEDIIKNHHLRM